MIFETAKSRFRSNLQSRKRWLIFCPFLLSIQERLSDNNGSEIVLGSIDGDETNSVTTASGLQDRDAENEEDFDEDEVIAPQIKIGADGQAVIDEARYDRNPLFTSSFPCMVCVRTSLVSLLDTNDFLALLLCRTSNVSFCSTNALLALCLQFTIYFVVCC